MKRIKSWDCEDCNRPITQGHYLYHLLPLEKDTKEEWVCVWCFIDLLNITKTHRTDYMTAKRTWTSNEPKYIQEIELIDKTLEGTKKEEDLWSK